MTNNKIEVSFKLEDIPMIIETLEKIQNENKQLKGILQEIYERAINTNISLLDFRDYILEILGEKENE